MLARPPVKQAEVILLIQADSAALLEIINSNLLILQKFFALAAFMEANENISANIHTSRLMVMDCIKPSKNLVEEVLPSAICYG